MAEGGYKIDYAAAERDAAELQRQAEELLRLASNIAHEEGYLLGDEGEPGWSDMLSQAHRAKVEECVAGFRDSAERLDTIARGILKTVETYRQADQGTSAN